MIYIHIKYESLLTPFQTPTTPSDTPVSVEKDMDSLCDTGYIMNWIVIREKSQQCAIAIGYFNVVNTASLQLKIREVDVDDIAFGNFDGFPLVQVVAVGGWEVGRGHLSVCWEALGFF